MSPGSLPIQRRLQSEWREVPEQARKEGEGEEERAPHIIVINVHVLYMYMHVYKQYMLNRYIVHVHSVYVQTYLRLISRRLSGCTEGVVIATQQVAEATPRVQMSTIKERECFQN